MERSLKRTNAQVSARIRALRHDIEQEFGALPKLVSRLAGPALLWLSRREERRIARGRTYEPPLIVERRNWAT